MQVNLEHIASRAINSASVQANGNLTNPRTYGVYVLPPNHGSTKRYRIGNHPVRQRELEVEHGSAKLLYLFTARPDAESVARLLDRLKA